MPGKSVIINYNLCDFKECSDGVCKAKAICEKKVLKQEAPFEPALKAVLLKYAVLYEYHRNRPYPDPLLNHATL